MRRLGPRQRRRDDDSEQERERDENRAERIGRDRRHRRGQHGDDAHEREESTAAQHDSVSTSRLYGDRARCARRWHFCAAMPGLSGHRHTPTPRFPTRAWCESACRRRAPRTDRHRRARHRRSRTPSAHAAVVPAVERDVVVVCPADGLCELRVLNLDQRRLEPDELVLPPLQQPAKCRQLHLALLKSAVGKDQRHAGNQSLSAPGRLARLRSNVPSGR